MPTNGNIRNQESGAGYQTGSPRGGSCSTQPEPCRSPPARHRLFWAVGRSRNILARLGGWDYANMEAIAAVRSGQLPAFYAHYDPDWRSFNAGLVRQYRQASLAEAIAAAEASHVALLSAAEAIPAEALFLDYGVRSPQAGARLL